jgi:hypothetical protein
MVSGRRTTPLLLTAALATLAACGSGYHYAKQATPRLIYRTAGDGSVGLAEVRGASTYFKLPPKWKLLDEEDYLRASGSLDTETPEQSYLVRHKQRVQPFDANPSPSVSHVIQPGPTPSGFSAVYVLDDDERDGISLQSLRNAAISVDPEPVSGTSNAEVLLHDSEVVRSGGFHGNRVIFNVRTDAGTLLTVDKTTLVDDHTRVIYMFVVACESKCFRDQQKEIEQVVDSWTIKER